MQLNAIMYECFLHADMTELKRNPHMLPSALACMAHASCRRHVDRIGPSPHLTPCTHFRLTILNLLGHCLDNLLLSSPLSLIKAQGSNAG